MDWKDLGKKVGAAGLTVLGTALAGPAGATIGGMVGQAIFGDGSDDISAEKINTALSNPDTLLKLKQFELDHQIEINKLVLEQTRLELGDKASARSREVETTKATGKRDTNLYALAWLGILGYMAILVYLISCGLPKMSAELALMVGNLIGIVGAKFSTIYDYFFGAGKELINQRAADKA
ncbi:MAG: hypothetical protein LLF89_04315 [Spirochaetaceae bacterium]|nr:hypothetical protein [Spirochaetaceae bacterium]